MKKKQLCDGSMLELNMKRPQLMNVHRVNPYQAASALKECSINCSTDSGQAASLETTVPMKLELSNFTKLLYTTHLHINIYVILHKNNSEV